MTNSETRHAAGSDLPRVCLLTETFHPIVGGGETYSRLFSGKARQLGMDIFILTRRVEPDYPPLDEIDGVPVVRVAPTGMLRFGKYVMIPFVLRELFRKQKEFDVVYVVNFRVLGIPGVIAARLLGKKCVLRQGTCGELSGEYFEAHDSLPRLAGLALSLPLRLRKALLMGADAFVSISSAIDKEFRQCGVSEEKMTSIPNGVNTELFHPVSVEKRAVIRQQLGLPEKRFTIGYSGKLNRGKGLEHLITAWPSILSRFPDSHLVFIGSGGNQTLSCEQHLRDFVREHSLESSVTFTGYVQNVHQYLKALDAYAIPTEFEALSNALLEAASCGLPCISCPVGGIPDIITHEENGLLVPPADPDALGEAICSLQSDPELAARLGTAARRTVEERFSLEAVVKMHLGLFSRLTGRTPHNEEVGSLA